MRYLLILTLVSTALLWSHVQVQGCYLYLSVDGQNVENGGKRYISQDNLYTIKCRYDFVLSQPPKLTRIEDGHESPPLRTTNDVSTRILTYQSPAEQRQTQVIYHCKFEDQCDVSITVSTSNTVVPTTSTKSEKQINTLHATAGNPVQPTDSTTSFTGLNPLIYTISAVILLGSLAIVAIITCWIRARRSFHNRSLRSAQTAQDYFDYLSDGEFTPLTSEEFQASLQERPPTYNQSEQLESGEPPATEPTEPQQTISPEEAAIIENLIALNLLSEDVRRQSPRQQQSSPQQPNRRVRIRLSGPGASQPANNESPTVIGHRDSSDGVEGGGEAALALRSVGERAQRLLEEQRSTGELVSLQPDTQ